MLAGRYRILGLLGQGGMGEVYRAFDLILNQAVALKFLAGAKMSEAALIRFRNEVRVARQVSHPNVCRVYDIGMVEGLHFISMEYLDGEDLDSLIRRIGRLPQDKAIEFARKICAGLSAAHERGVLHRDLKPANIMIDGRGQVRITDFGLAALAAEIPLSDLRSGTPAYMSPEQKAGKEVTTRSDLYSLGLVLYEMFTGKRRSDTQTNPTEIVKDLDPAVERVILRCLEEDPKRRPSSALNVAVALPGGDPIAAALAAGETPSPEMVAASQEKEGFTPRIAWVCFAGVLLSMALVAWTRPHSDITNYARLDIPPDGLAFRAREILKQLGYAELPKQVAYGFDVPGTSFLTRAETYETSRRNALLASHQPAVIRFWYRQHQDDFEADSFVRGSPAFLCCMVYYDSPPNLDPGMIRLGLDAKGRLIALEIRPPARAAPGSSAQAPDWALLFTAAGLDMARFAPAAPQETPPMAVDARAAWTGTYGEDRQEKLRVEAGSWAGRLVYFNLTGDWAVSMGAPPLPVSPASRLFFVCVILLIVLVGVLLALHNVTLGRGDRRGAAALAAISFMAAMLAWLLSANHVASFGELILFTIAASWAAFAAGLLWCLYMAIEPYVRRQWPDALISWSRLQTGRLRDPLVASHLLAGIFGGIALGALINPLIPLVDSTLRVPSELLVLDSSRHFSAVLLSGFVIALFGSLGILVLVAGARMLVRPAWLADTLFCTVVGILQLGNPTLPGIRQRMLAAFLIVPTVYIVLWALRRLGLLCLVAGGCVAVFTAPTPFSLTSWFADRSFALLLIQALVSAWAVWVILSAQRRPITESPA